MNPILGTAYMLTVFVLMVIASITRNSRVANILRRISGILILALLIGNGKDFYIDIIKNINMSNPIVTVNNIIQLLVTVAVFVLAIVLILKSKGPMCYLNNSDNKTGGKVVDNKTDSNSTD